MGASWSRASYTGMVDRIACCHILIVHVSADDSSHQHGASDSHSSKPPKIFLDQELATMIDPILVSDDRNKDGFIDYYEFVAAQNAQVEASS